MKEGNMVNYIKTWLRNEKSRTIYWVLLTIIFITCVFFFIVVNLSKNRDYFVEHYENEQQLLVNQVAIRMQKELIAAEGNYLEAIDNIVNGVETLRRRYWLFAIDDQILFIRNKDTTKLYNTIDDFIYQNQEDKLHISTSDFTYNNNKYTVGVCTEESYILESGQIIKLNFYIILTTIVMCLSLLVIILVFISYSRTKEDKIIKLNKDIIEKNKIIDNLSNDIKKARQNKISNTLNSKGTIYSKDVLNYLLKKIIHEDLLPLTIMILEMNSEESYPFHRDFRECVKPIFDLIDDDYIIAEILPGVFTILLFTSNEEKTEAIKESLINKWGNSLVQMGIEVRIAMTKVDNLDVNVEDVFNLVYKEVVGNNVNISI